MSTSPPLKAVYISTSTYLASLIFAKLVYRVSPFHPLAIYPGPFGCRLTKFWMAAVSFTGQQHNYIKSLHDRYGDVVRIGASGFSRICLFNAQHIHVGPNEVSIKDPSVVHAMLGPAGLPHGPSESLIAPPLLGINTPPSSVLWEITCSDAEGHADAGHDKYS